MLFERKNTDKINKGSILVGYDLGDDFSQISYCILGESEVESVATVVGTKQYNIPTVLCKRKGVNQWLFGKDALKYSSEQEDSLITHLLSAAKKGDNVVLEETEYDPIALLTLFMKRSLSLLGFVVSVDKINAIMFTVNDLDDRMVEVLAKAAVNLNLETSHIYFQSHTESFYYFVLNQQEELRNYQVLACEHDGMQLKTYRLERNKRTTPIVVLIDEQNYGTMVLPGEDEPEEIKEDSYRVADEKLLQVLQSQCDGRIISSAYLLGDGFRDNWAEKSLQFLCRNRRVFQGNNLFCKGACYSLTDKFEPGKASKEHIFLGPDKLKSNIGMKVMKRGKESYFALLDAGENWYEVHRECVILLPGKETEITFLVTPLTGKSEIAEVIMLENAPSREDAFGRYRLEMKMTSPDRVAVTLTDLGFGELFAASGKVWEKYFSV